MGRKQVVTRPLEGLRRLDRRLTRRAASWTSPWVRQVLPAVDSAAEGTKLWWGMAVLMAATGGRTQRKAAAAGLLGMVTAQVLSNAACKQLLKRPRPPRQLIPHDDAEDRPDSSSFPSGHTAAAAGFTAAVAATSPWWAAAAGAVTAMVALDRVHTGAHYPSDIAAGAAIGIASARLVHHAPRLLFRVVLRRASKVG
ncbi:phosphatase PAP2 family protein [Streptomyces sp. NPDC127092]|uniref:phosphatase PAP2 family protein n=1 Tax=Streptomyces sp. NPDC127092 TaxID=3347135 RepID=UPI00364D190D